MLDGGKNHPSVFLNLSIWLIDWHILSGIETAKATCLKCVMYLRNFFVELNQRRGGWLCEEGWGSIKEDWISHHYNSDYLLLSLIKCIIIIQQFMFYVLCFLKPSSYCLVWLKNVIKEIPIRSMYKSKFAEK